MADLQIFNFNKNQIRIVVVDGETIFVGKDVCDTLDIKNSRDALNSLDEEDKASVVITDTSSSTRETITMTGVKESGLYKLIFKSRKPEAKTFQRWVTKEVIPTIRKTGSYIQFPTSDLQQRYYDIVNDDSLSNDDKGVEIYLLILEKQKLEVEQKKENKRLKKQLFEERNKIENIQRMLKNNLDYFQLDIDDEEEIENIANGIQQLFNNIHKNIDKLNEHKNRWYPVRVFINNEFPNDFNPNQNKIIGKLCKQLHIRLNIEKKFNDTDYRSDIIYAICDAAQHQDKIRMNLVLECAEKYLALIIQNENDDDFMLE